MHAFRHGIYQSLRVTAAGFSTIIDHVRQQGSGAAREQQQRHMGAIAVETWKASTREESCMASGGGVFPLGKDLDRKTMKLCSELSDQNPTAVKKEAMWQAEMQKALVQDSSCKRFQISPV